LHSSFQPIRAGVWSAEANGDYLLSTIENGFTVRGIDPILSNDRTETTTALAPQCDGNGLGPRTSMYQTTLKTTPLGQTGLEITRVGFGAWAIGGGGWEFGWGPQDDQESIAAIRHALEQGINWIDTAAAYGLGPSEKIVGRALGGVAERPYVFTKCSLLKALTARSRTA
jgi:hypothetical protein